MPLRRMPRMPAAVSPPLPSAPPPAPAGPASPVAGTPMTKGMMPQNAGYAHGGEVITSRSRFMKVPDPFRTDIDRSNYEKKSSGGELSKTSGESKVQPVIKPRK